MAAGGIWERIDDRRVAFNLHSFYEQSWTFMSLRVISISLLKFCIVTAY
jgi:hypothetical protein